MANNMTASGINHDVVTAIEAAETALSCELCKLMSYRSKEVAEVIQELTRTEPTISGRLLLALTVIKLKDKYPHG